MIKQPIKSPIHRHHQSFSSQKNAVHQQNLSALDAQISEIRSRDNDVQSQIDRLKRKFNLKPQNFNHSQSQNLSSSNFQESRNQGHSHCRNCSGLQKKLINMQKKYRPFKDEIKLIALENARLAKVNNSLRDKTAQLESEVERKARQTEIEIEKENKLIVQYKIKDMECVALLKQNKSLTSGIEGLKKEIGSMKIELQTNETFREGKFLQQNTELESTIRMYTQQLKEREQEIQRQSFKFKEFQLMHEETLKKNKQAYEELEKVFKKELEEKQRVIELINRTIQNEGKNRALDLSSKIQSIQESENFGLTTEEEKGLREQIRSLEALVFRLEQQNMKQRSQIMNLDEKNSRSELTIDEIRAQAMEQYEMLERKTRYYEKHEQEYLNKMITYEQRCSNLELSVELLEKNFKSEECQKLQLTKKVKQLNAEIEERENQYQNTLYELEAVRRQRQRLNGTIGQLESAVKEHQQETEKSSSRLLRLQQGLSREQSEKQQLSLETEKTLKQKDAKIQYLNEQISKNQNEFQERSEMYQQEVSGIKILLQTERNDKQVLEKQILGLQKQISEHRIQVSRMHSQIIDLQNEVNQAKDQKKIYQKNLQESKRQSEAYKEDVYLKNKQLNNLAIEKEKTDKQIAVLEHQKSVLENELQKVTLQMNAKNRQQSQAKSSKENLQINLQRQITELREQLVILKVSRDENEKGCQELKRQVSRKDGIISNLNSALIEQKQKLKYREAQQMQMKASLSKQFQGLISKKDQLIAGRQQETEKLKRQFDQMKSNFESQIEQILSENIHKVQKLESQYCQLEENLKQAKQKESNLRQEERSELTEIQAQRFKQFEEVIQKQREQVQKLNTHSQVIEEQYRISLNQYQSQIQQNEKHKVLQLSEKVSQINEKEKQISKNIGIIEDLKSESQKRGALISELSQSNKVLTNEPKRIFDEMQLKAKQKLLEIEERSKKLLQDEKQFKKKRSDFEARTEAGWQKLEAQEAEIELRERAIIQNEACLHEREESFVENEAEMQIMLETIKNLTNRIDSKSQIIEKVQRKKKQLRDSESRTALSTPISGESHHLSNDQGTSNSLNRNLAEIQARINGFFKEVQQVRDEKKALQQLIKDEQKSGSSCDDPVKLKIEEIQQNKEIFEETINPEKYSNPRVVELLSIVKDLFNELLQSHSQESIKEVIETKIIKISDFVPMSGHESHVFSLPLKESDGQIKEKNDLVSVSPRSGFQKRHLKHSKSHAQFFTNSIEEKVLQQEILDDKAEQPISEFFTKTPKKKSVANELQIDIDEIISQEKESEQRSIKCHTGRSKAESSDQGSDSRYFGTHQKSDYIKSQDSSFMMTYSEQTNLSSKEKEDRYKSNVKNSKLSKKLRGRKK